MRNSGLLLTMLAVALLPSIATGLTVSEAFSLLPLLVVLFILPGYAALMEAGIPTPVSVLLSCPVGFTCMSFVYYSLSFFMPVELTVITGFIASLAAVVRHGGPAAAWLRGKPRFYPWPAYAAVLFLILLVGPGYADAYVYADGSMGFNVPDATWFCGVANQLKHGTHITQPQCSESTMVGYHTLFYFAIALLSKLSGIAVYQVWGRIGRLLVIICFMTAAWLYCRILMRTLLGRSLAFFALISAGGLQIALYTIANNWSALMSGAWPLPYYRYTLSNIQTHYMALLSAAGMTVPNLLTLVTLLALKAPSRARVGARNIVLLAFIFSTAWIHVPGAFMMGILFAVALFVTRRIGFTFRQWSLTVMILAVVAWLYSVTMYPTVWTAQVGMTDNTVRNVRELVEIIFKGYPIQTALAAASVPLSIRGLASSIRGAKSGPWMLLSLTHAVLAVSCLLYLFFPASRMVSLYFLLPLQAALNGCSARRIELIADSLLRRRILFFLAPVWIVAAVGTLLVSAVSVKNLGAFVIPADRVASYVAASTAVRADCALMIKNQDDTTLPDPYPFAVSALVGRPVLQEGNNIDVNAPTEEVKKFRGNIGNLNRAFFAGMDSDAARNMLRQFRIGAILVDDGDSWPYADADLGGSMKDLPGASRVYLLPPMWEAR